MEKTATKGSMDVGCFLALEINIYTYTVPIGRLVTEKASIWLGVGLKW